MGQQASTPGAAAATASKPISYPKPVDMATVMLATQREEAKLDPLVSSPSEEAFPPQGLRIIVRGQEPPQASSSSESGSPIPQNRATEVGQTPVRHVSLDSAYGSANRTSPERSSDGWTSPRSSGHSRTKRRVATERPASHWSPDSQIESDSEAVSLSAASKRLSKRFSRHSTGSGSGNSSPRLGGRVSPEKRAHRTSYSKGKRPTIVIVGAERVGSKRYSQLSAFEPASTRQSLVVAPTQIASDGLDIVEESFVLPDPPTPEQSVNPRFAAPSVVRVLEGHPANHHNRFKQERRSTAGDIHRRSSDAPEAWNSRQRFGSTMSAPETPRQRFGSAASILEARRRSSQPRKSSVPLVPSGAQASQAATNQRRSSAPRTSLASTQGHRFSETSLATSGSASHKVEVPLLFSADSRLYRSQSSRRDSSAVYYDKRRVSRQPSFPSSVQGDASSIPSRKSPASQIAVEAVPLLSQPSAFGTSLSGDRSHWHAYTMTASAAAPVSDAFAAVPPEAAWVEAAAAEEDLVNDSPVSSVSSAADLANSMLAPTSLLTSPDAPASLFKSESFEPIRLTREGPRSVSPSIHSAGRTERQASATATSYAAPTMTIQRSVALESVDPASLAPTAAASPAALASPTFEGFGLRSRAPAARKLGDVCSPTSFPVDDYFESPIARFGTPSLDSPSLASSMPTSPAALLSAHAPHDKTAIDATFGTLVTNVMGVGTTPRLSPALSHNGGFSKSPRQAHIASDCEERLYRNDSQRRRHTANVRQTTTTRIGPDVSISYDPTLSRRRFSSAPVDPRIHDHACASEEEGPKRSLADALGSTVVSRSARGAAAPPPAALEDDENEEDVLPRLGDAHKRGFNKVEIRSWLLQNRRESQQHHGLQAVPV